MSQKDEGPPRLSLPVDTTKNLANEGRPHVYSRQRNRKNHLAESDAQYWKRSVAIAFLDVICFKSEEATDSLVADWS